MPTKLPPVPTGDHPIVQWLQKLLKCLEERTIVSVSGGSMDRKENGVVLRVGQEEKFGESLDIRRLSIKSVASDYVVCNPFSDPDTIDTGTEYTVAKDPTFRGGDTRQIIGPNNVTLSQSLEPLYTVGEIIYAIFGIDGETDAMGGDGERIDALEVAPSRQWVDPWQAVCVKVNGVQKTMLVRGSPPLP
jgi:hypothetical protein